MKQSVVAALGVGLMAWSGSSALAGRVIDGFEWGATQVQATAHGFGSTVAAGINADGGNGDQARYFSWTTYAGGEVRFDNVTVPGTMKLRHAGGPSSQLNLSYGFSVPADFTRFAALELLGVGAGQATLTLALQDSDGDILWQSFAQAGAWGNVSAALSQLQCQSQGGGVCRLNDIVGFELAASGLSAGPFSYDLAEIRAVDAPPSASSPTAPIPEPRTWILMLVGLLAIGTSVRDRCRDR